MWENIAIVILVILVVLVAAIICNTRGRRDPEDWVIKGGAGLSRAPEKKCIIVDTLNITHWLKSTAKKRLTLTTCDVIETIDATSPILREQYPDGVAYVTKDREIESHDERVRAMYRAAAHRNRVDVHVVERYEGGRRVSVDPGHIGLARDDFYAIILANKRGCPVLTEDRFRDFDNMMRGGLPPFHVYVYTYWKELGTREYVNPKSILRGQVSTRRKIHKPRRISPAEYFTPAPSGGAPDGA